MTKQQLLEQAFVGGKEIDEHYQAGYGVEHQISLLTDHIRNLIWIIGRIIAMLPDDAETRD